MRGVIAAIVMTSLAASSLAAAAPDSGVLAPGKPAGVAGAQADNTTFYVIASGLLLVGAVSFLISTDHSSTSPLVIAGGNGYTATGSGGSGSSTGTQ